MITKYSIMHVSNHKNLRPVEVVSLAEKCLWGERQTLLKEHNSYRVRNSYYPYRMDEWYEKEANICREYNIKIARLNRIRKEVNQNRDMIIHYINNPDDRYDETVDFESDMDSDNQSNISDVTTDTSINAVSEEQVDYQSDSSNSIVGFKQVLFNTLKFVWG